MLLELGRFGSLLLSILSFVALFHTAFLMPASSLEERIFACLEMLALTAAISWVSGWIFCRWEREAGGHPCSISASFPMKIFWWGCGIMLLLFAGAWYLETYFRPWKYSGRW